MHKATCFICSNVFIENYSSQLCTACSIEDFTAGAGSAFAPPTVGMKTLHFQINVKKNEEMFLEHVKVMSELYVLSWFVVL